MGSPGVTSNRFGAYTLAREVGTPSISKFDGIPRKRMLFADHFPRGPFPAARRGAPLAELPAVSMEGIRGPGYTAVKIMGEGDPEQRFTRILLSFLLIALWPKEGYQAHDAETSELAYKKHEDGITRNICC